MRGNVHTVLFAVGNQVAFELFTAPFARQFHARGEHVREHRVIGGPAFDGVKEQSTGANLYGQTRCSRAPGEINILAIHKEAFVEATYFLVDGTRYQ